MTGARNFQFGELIALPRPGEARADSNAAAHAELSTVDLHNVIPFARPRTHDPSRTAPELMLPSDAVRPAPESLARGRARLLAFMALSLALHGGLFALLMRDPPPLASIGLEVISVEIVLGATAPAGVATDPGENETQAAAAPEEKSTEPEQTEQKATEQPQEVAVARQETAPEQKTEPQVKPEEPRREEPKPQDLKPEEPKPFETAAAPRETAPPEKEQKPEQAPAVAEPKPSIAMIETPNPDTATAPPRETPPEQEFTLLPQPAEKPVEVEREPDPKPKPVQAAPPKPVKDAAPAHERKRIAAPTREKAAKEAKPSTPSSQANNVGIGRSNATSNYPGLVSAHLRRYQQYPSDARSRGDQGTATVTFSLDGGGRVTSARLARSSGITSIDSEVTAMVRRASPFPAPPSGQGQSFTVPVNFRLN